METFFRDAGVGLMRAVPEPTTVTHWPDPKNVQELREWIDKLWSQRHIAESVTVAAPGLATRVDEICSGQCDHHQVRRAAVSLARYVLRMGRSTPFGLFAGVAPAEFGATTTVCWESRHRPIMRVDTVWLDDVLERLEADTDLLSRLPVMITNLATPRGDKLLVPLRTKEIAVDLTAPVREVVRLAAAPIRFDDLAARLADAFEVEDMTVRRMLAELVHLGVLVTSLRAPSTLTNPLGHVVEQLKTFGATGEAARLLHELEGIHTDLGHHNQSESTDHERLRRDLGKRMRAVSTQGRTPLATHLYLRGTFRVPHQVATDLAGAASALLRLAPHSRNPVWRDYHAAFLARYGIGALVPLRQVIDSDLGLGYPSGYPGAQRPMPKSAATDRDARLLSLAHEAFLAGRREIALDDATITAITGDADLRVPPHVEIAARIHATTRQALDRGEYTLTVTPAYAAGVMTSRFITTDSSLGRALTELPTSVAGAIPAQVVAPPEYPHAQNVGRVPRFIEHTIPIGEHPGDGTVIALDDLAVTADWGRLYLVSRSRQRVVEPQVFHALALEKQPPPLVRFLVNLARNSATPYVELDWGTAARLPYLPRVRFGRVILTPARWLLTPGDLPRPRSSVEEWTRALRHWAQRWQVPDRVELRNGDHVLPLNLSVPMHAELLRSHLEHKGEAVLTEAPEPSGLGWIDGHPHEVAVPLVSTQDPMPAPPRGRLVTNDVGQLPGSACSRWLDARLYVPAQRQQEVIVDHLPRLLQALPGRAWWYIRYRDTTEAHHLRVRLQIHDRVDYGTCATVAGEWADHLHQAGLCSRMVLDTYRPEVGRYGDGPLLAAAEAVFAADSAVAAAQLQELPPSIDPRAAGAVNALDIVHRFIGCATAARDWLIAQPPPPRPTTSPSRAVTDQAVTLTNHGQDVAEWAKLGSLRQARGEALANYRTALPTEADTETVLSSLVHMHHNRVFGVDHATERAALRLARAVALSLRDRPPEAP